MLERFGYKPPIPEGLQREYETALHGVMRWKNGNWADNIYETDMDHVAGMFIVLQDMNNSCPNLPSDIDTEAVKHMIYIHDQGEISVGDLTHNRHDYEIQYPEWKRKEYIAGRWQLRRIRDKGIRLNAETLYDRCFNIKDDDKEAMLTDFIDKMQGQGLVLEMYSPEEE